MHYSTPTECDHVRIIAGAAKCQRTVGTAGVVMLRVFLEHGAQVSTMSIRSVHSARIVLIHAFGVRVPFSGTAVPTL